MSRRPGRVTRAHYANVYANTDRRFKSIIDAFPKWTVDPQPKLCVSGSIAARLMPGQEVSFISTPLVSGYELGMTSVNWNINWKVSGISQLQVGFLFIIRYRAELYRDPSVEALGSEPYLLRISLSWAFLSSICSTSQCMYISDEIKIKQKQQKTKKETRPGKENQLHLAAWIRE